MARHATLPFKALPGHHVEVDDTEATQLILETLFDVRAAIYEIHDVVVGEDEDDEEEEEDA